MPSLFRCLLLLLLILGSTASFAQSSDQPSTAAPAATPAQTLDQLGSQLDIVKAALKDNKS